MIQFVKFKHFYTLIAIGCAFMYKTEVRPWTLLKTLCTYYLFLSEFLFQCSVKSSKTKHPIEDSNNEVHLIVAEYLVPARDIPTDPLFYGFFYEFNVSESLGLISQKYLAVAYDNVPEFANFLDKTMSESNITDPFAFYQKAPDPETGRLDPYFHTTGMNIKRLILNMKIVFFITSYFYFF